MSVGGPTSGRDLGVNPFLRPIEHTWRSLLGIKWRFPFLPQFIQVLVGITVLGILLFLFATIGVVAQISSTIGGLISDAVDEIRKSDKMEEKAAYGISIGIYFLILVPLWVIQGPFWLIGKLVDQIRPERKLSFADLPLGDQRLEEIARTSRIQQYEKIVVVTAWVVPIATMVASACFAVACFAVFVPMTDDIPITSDFRILTIFLGVLVGIIGIAMMGLNIWSAHNLSLLWKRLKEVVNSSSVR